MAHIRVKALLIPCDQSQPIEFVDLEVEPTEDDGEELHGLEELVFRCQPDIPPSLGFSSVAIHGVQVVYDDLGRYRDNIADLLNPRARQFLAGLLQRPVKKMYALVGNFVFLGYDVGTGETIHLPYHVQEAAKEMFP